jgi:hypothetical protein
MAPHLRGGATRRHDQADGFTIALHCGAVLIVLDDARDFFEASPPDC